VAFEQVVSVRNFNAHEQEFLGRRFDMIYAADVENRSSWLRSHASDVRAVITNGRVGLSADEIAALPQLGIICASGAGYENIAVEAASSRGIVVTHSPGGNAPAVADHALALMLAVARNIVGLNRLVAQGGWRDAHVLPDQIAGRRLGILGLGAIGREVAARGEGFGMRVRYFSRHAVRDVPWERADSVPALAEESDFLVVAVPGGPSTKGLVDAEVLRRLGPRGYLVNVGRGSSVVTEDLISALREGVIAGAGLDVVEGEPDIPPALRELEKVVVTPHVAGVSPESSIARLHLIAENLEAFFRDGTCVTPIR
jgi:lactate dehydrogenase-like 2-hydroxyacid dehydrogenase